MGYLTLLIRISSLILEHFRPISGYLNHQYVTTFPRKGTGGLGILIVIGPKSV